MLHFLTINYIFYQIKFLQAVESHVLLIKMLLYNVFKMGQNCLRYHHDCEDCVLIFIYF